MKLHITKTVSTGKCGTDILYVAHASKPEYGVRLRCDVIIDGSQFDEYANAAIRDAYKAGKFVVESP